MIAAEYPVMKPASFILAVLASFALSAAAMAKPGYVSSTVNLRAAAGTTNEIVAKIPGRSLVDVGECTGGWCAVTWQDKSGFAIQTALDVSGRVPRGPAYPPPDNGYVAMGPPTVYYEEPPVYYRPRPYYYGYYGPRHYWRRW
jgi:uncharacterized protein YraI